MLVLNDHPGAVYRIAYSGEKYGFGTASEPGTDQKGVFL
jgi:hypothetical protein